MRQDLVYLKMDSRSRVSLKKLGDLSTYYKAYSQDGKIILEPVSNEHDEVEAWLFEPENKKILMELKEALKQKGTISRGSFAKYAKD